MLVSCDDAALDEVPLDFYSPESAFSTVSGFEAALTDLYAKERLMYYGGGDVSYTLFHGTDMWTNIRQDGSDEKLWNYTRGIGSTKWPMRFYWDSNFKIISNANIIMKGAEVSTLSPEKLAPLVVEAKFFRAKAYRDLVYLYGDVPLTLEPATEAKDDFVRAPKNEVLEQMVKDFQEAAEKLPAISAVQDGRISNLVAYHFLAETLISLGRNTEAVAALDKVIGDPNVKLMTTRFGRRSTVFGKDVIWDLTQRGNQNRKSGNKEALWVIQFEDNNLAGGGTLTTSRTMNVLERMHVPAVWQLLGKDGKPGFLGKGSGDVTGTGGFGISSLVPTPYLDKTIWPAGYVGDLRCNNANFVKDAFFNNPATISFGKSIKDPNHKSTNWNPNNMIASGWRFYPWFIKATTPDDHPIGILDPNHPAGLNQSISGSTYHDMYLLRLAESYLLRAEAYVNLGNTVAAAADINVVRSRALATPVTPGEVNIDYILDERARELLLEEQRRITLGRMGNLLDRLKRYNAITWPTVLPDRHALWPIPQNAIEANLGAVLKQNPGY